MRKQSLFVIILLPHLFFAGDFLSLIKAIRGNNLEKFHELLQHENLDLNQFKWGVTPLYIAIHYERVEMIEPLIKNGADVDILAGPKKRTPSHKAVKQGNKPIVEILIKAKANIDQEDKNGETPLIEAVKKDQEDIARLLVASGANKSKKSWSKKYPGTALDIANQLDCLWAKELLQE